MNINSLMIISTLCFISSPTYSADIDHAGCSSDVTVTVEKIGTVNEAKLHEQIDKINLSIDSMGMSRVRGAAHRKALTIELTAMRRAMVELHNIKLTNGCAAAAHGASVETRLTVLEKYVNTLQQVTND